MAFSDLHPRHRCPIQLPGPWPTCVKELIRPGGAWLQGGDTGEGLLTLPGPALVSRWDGRAWITRLGEKPLALPPWDALEAVLGREPGPWLGAASFELACDEAALPRKPLAPGTLGQHWTAVQEALWVRGNLAELWSWTERPPDPTHWEVRNPPLMAMGGSPLSLDAAWSEGQHRAAVERIRACILEGGFYVANLCVPFAGAYDGDPVDLALAAFMRALPPFGALLDLGGPAVLSLSMERLLSRRGQRLWSQPIKGSAPLTGNAELDRAHAEALRADPKERAEHTMILDLVRNDLGRVAQAGTVAVTDYMTLQHYPTVQHLVSTVEAEARPGLGLAELLRSMLPGGSVTGAPKHAVCSHLARREAGPRGFYCGAVGWILPSGDLDLALPIRTAQIQGNRLTYWTGGGITRLSDPAREWAELHLKTLALTGP